MKVLGLIPADYSKTGVLVQLSGEEWNILTHGDRWDRDAKETPKGVKPKIGLAVDICDRWAKLTHLENCVETAAKTPVALRGMADALESVVEAAKKAITPPADDDAAIPLGKETA